MRRPEVSIITTSYNQGEFIEYTIESVLNQTYDNIQYIIVDAGSHDQTSSILRKYSDKISLIIVEPDNGPADALNKGFSHATGDYLAFINSDDVYFPQAIESLVTHIEPSAADVVYSDVCFIDKLGVPFFPYKLPYAFAVPVSPKSLLAKAGIIPQQGSLWSRRLFDSGLRFNTDNQTCWDLEFYVEALCRGFVFDVVPELLSCFRIHDQSITGESVLKDSSAANSRSSLRKIDHLRIRQILIDYGYTCSNIEAIALHFTNSAFKLKRCLPYYARKFFSSMSIH